MSLQRANRKIRALIQATCLIAISTLVCATPIISNQPNISQHNTARPAAKAQIWNLKNADIRAVIQTVSMVTGKNFIIDPRVNGKVTLISHKPMSPDEIYQVFLSLLQVLNYTAIPGQNSIKIVPSIDAKGYNSPIENKKHPTKGDAIVVKIVHVDNLSAIDLIPILRPLMQSWGSISAYTPTNSLILTDTAANINRLTHIIKNMEHQRTQQTNVIPLKYSNAKKLAQTLQSLQQSQQAKGQTSTLAIAADKQNNSLLVSGNLRELLEMKNLVKTLDIPGKSDDKNTRVFHLNYLDATKLAPLLVNMIQGRSGSAASSASDASDTDDNGTTGSSAPTVGGSTTTSAASANADGNAALKDGSSIQAVPEDNAIIAHASPQVLATLKTVIAKLDVKPDQVLVEAVIVKINQKLMDQLGIEWGQVQASMGADGSISSNFTSGATTFGSRGNGNSFGLIQGTSLAVILHAINQNSSTDILSTPSIVVLNNQKATISNGTNIGIQNREYALNNSGQNPQNQDPEDGIYNTIQRKDITLSLNVTPRISPNNMLQLQIDEKDDSLDGSSSAGDLNPTITTSKIKTKVLVNSGDILVLGGLIDNQQTKSKTKIPILGSIPLIGKLFTYDNNTVTKQNLMVFIRPIILRSNSNSYRQTNHRYQYMRTQQMKAIAGRQTTSDLPLLPRMPRNNKMLLPAPATTIIKR